MRFLFRRQRMPLRDAVIFLQASSTTCCRRVLCDKNRMIPPGRLAAIVLRLRWSKTLRDEVIGLLHHVRQSPRLEIRELATRELELAAKR